MRWIQNIGVHIGMEESCAGGILASIENVDLSRLRPEVIAKNYDVLYTWHTPVGSLAERKTHTENRREELLHLLHQDSLSPDQIEGLIKEWIALVIERDKILHEEVDQENQMDKVEYIQGLKRLLRQRPAMEGSMDEMRLKDALLSLERHVTQYCRSHRIASPPPYVEPFRSLPPSLSRTHTHGLGAPDSDPELIPTLSPILEVPDGPEMTSLPVVSSHNGLEMPQKASHPPQPPLTIVSSTQDTATGEPILPLAIPPPPPPPPPPPLPIHRGAVGTVQFSGVKRQTQSSPTDPSGGHTKRKPPPDLTIDTSSSLTKGLMDEIASVGKRNLRPTNRPRSPGGTPVKASKRLTLTGNNDPLQRALISKFRSMHSTPIRQSVIHESGSFDFSNAWSDINNSVEDPNITTSDLASGLMHGSDPNASKRSTAV